MTTLSQDDPHFSAMPAELESLWDRLHDNLEKLQEVVDRSELEGSCSKDVAQALWQEIEDACNGLGIVVFKALRLYQGLSNGGSTAALLTRKEMILKLNELGYSVTERYLNKLSGWADGYPGPPVVRLSPKTQLYKLDDAVAWAKSHFSSARALVVT